MSFSDYSLDIFYYWSGIVSLYRRVWV